MLKLAGVGTKPRLAEIKRECHARQHAGPQEGHLLSRGPVPGWCTGYQLAQGLKSAQRDLAIAGTRGVPEHFGLARAPTRGYSRSSGTEISATETVYPPIQGPGLEIPTGTPACGGVEANWPPVQTRDTRGYLQGGPWTVPNLPAGLRAPEELSRSPKPLVYPPGIPGDPGNRFQR
ncbi:hypothetical protein PGT21_009830 [Puccinia graminis f. sp. tritici]|uniref:Uncharacterized protein n=1 Tax=Puccinia graminis f. sp. tritici TaxID=56615 RepID=A0A5B0R0G2_PUCGR|nr:hypothetical protein PGT21_009830 [Puccinia graminis f. sp. tritici]